MSKTDSPISKEEILKRHYVNTRDELQAIKIRMAMEEYATWRLSQLKPESPKEDQQPPVKKTGGNYWEARCFAAEQVIRSSGIVGGNDYDNWIKTLK